MINTYRPAIGTYSGRLLLISSVLFVLLAFVPARAQSQGSRIQWSKGVISGVVAYCPTQPLIAAVQGFAEIVLYRTDGTLQQTIYTDHTEAISSLAFSADGLTLATGSWDASVKLWRVSDGVGLGTFTGHANAVYAVAFTPDGKNVASGSMDNTSKLWRISDGACVQTFSGHSDAVNSVAISPDGQTLASGSDDNTIKLWQVSDGKCLTSLTGHTNAVLSVTFAPDGLSLASGSNDGTAKLWRMSDNTCLTTIKVSTSNVHTVTFAPDGQTLATASYAVKTWRVSDGTNLSTIYRAGLWVAYSPDGQTLLSGGAAINLWRVSDSANLLNIASSTGWVSAVAVSPDKQTLASADTQNGMVTFYHTSDGTTSSSFTDAAFPYVLAYSPDGKTLATGDSDYAIRLWRVSDGACLSTIANAHPGRLYTLTFSPDGQMLASSCGNETDNLKLWSVSDGALIYNLAGHSGTVSSVTFSPDGLLLASGSYDKTIKFWRISNGTCVNTINATTSEVNAIAFSPDGQTLASGDRDALQLWRVSDGAALLTQSSIYGGVKSLAFSPDGQLLAAGHADGSIRVWREHDLSYLLLLGWHGYQISSVIFAADGLVASSGLDGLAVWDASSYQPDLLACNAGDTGYLGGGIYNNLTGQTITQNTLAGRPAQYLVNLWNAGFMTDIITLSAQGTAPGWTVQIFDGPSSTTPIDSASWSVTLAPSSGHLYRVEATPTATVANQNSLPVQVSATSSNDPRKTDAVALVSTKVAPLTAVALSVAPAAPVPVRTLVTLSATPTGGALVEYRFRAGYIDALGWHWSDLTGYTTTATCTWTPSLAAKYTLVVWTREAGHTASYDVYTAIDYQVIDPVVSAVSLSAVPASPQMMNTNITLTALATGSAQVEYRFRAGYTDTAGWHWSDLTGYTTNGTCNWTPGLAVNFTLVVWARTIGHTVSYEAYKALAYQVITLPVNAVSLYVSPASPQPVNTAITMIASATGSAHAEYKFRAGYTDTAGWHWSDLTGYTTTATCTWKPAVVQSYTLVVWARTVGHTAIYEAYKSLTFQVNTPSVNAVTLSAAPTAPQMVNTTITLSAIATGGGNVEYRFRAGYTDATGWHWNDLTGYTTTATCLWKPTLAVTYTVVVWARAQGHVALYDTFKSLTYLVTAPPLTLVALTATPPTPEPAKTAITLTATPTGGFQVEYRYRAGYRDAAGWQWSDLTGYTTATTCTWTPTTVGNYTLVVWAREKGHTAIYDVYQAIAYQVK